MLATGIALTTRAQDFCNLDFEQASGLPAPGQSAPFSQALPGWAGYCGTNLQPAVLYDNRWLDTAGISLLDAAFANEPMLKLTKHGTYCVCLYSGFCPGAVERYDVAASIAQTGRIPPGATNLWFNLGASYSWGDGDLMVSFNGVELPVSIISGSANGFSVRSVDVRTIAGQVGELRFAAPVANDPYGYPHWRNIFLLDYLRFMGVPQEPFSYSTNDGGITITKYNGPGGVVTIPNMINGLPVTGIGSYACFGNFNLTRVEIPDSVITIGEAAFLQCENLASVTIGDQVASVAGSAFYQCISLASVTIPNSTTNIGDAAFTHCWSLTNLTIGSGVTRIGDGAFQGCTSLANLTIPASVTTIGTSAFQECTLLTGVTIPASVTNLGNGPFGKCTRLPAIQVEALNPSYTSKDGVLFDRSGTVLIQYPAGKTGAYVIPGGVTDISEMAFYWCINLTRVVIPDSATRIGDYAFHTCYNLTNVIPGCGLTNIGNHAFTQCQRLTDFAFPGSVINIGEDAFSYCLALTRVVIPGQVAKLGDYAFYRCASLKGVCFLGDAPLLGGPYVFDPDYDLATVYYLPGTAGWGPTFGGRPAVLWVEAPILLTRPRTQTAEMGTEASLSAQATNALPMLYLWYFNNTGLELPTTTRQLKLANAQLTNSGSYTVICSNALGSVTSAPALLSVIPKVSRRLVPGVLMIAQPASLLAVEYSPELGSGAAWSAFPTVYFTNSPQYFFDLTSPLPPRRFYRVAQLTGTHAPPMLAHQMVPALDLSGAPGERIRVDGINRHGPTDAWFTLDTVTLREASQLYFDLTAPGQPQRLYRLQSLP